MSLDELIDAHKEIEKQMASISLQCQEMIKDLSKKEVLFGMCNIITYATLNRQLKSMAHKSSLEVLVKFAYACGYDVQISFVRRK